MATKLYVGNLSFSTTEGDLRRLFESCGSVTSCSMIIDKFTGKSRGFAFVEMSSSAEAAKAISELHGKDCDGRPLTVNEAKPREDRPRGGGGGGYCGGGGGGGGYGGGGGGRGGDRGGERRSRF
jgi:cold-inducible RNA-binding protein